MNSQSKSRDFTRINTDNNIEIIEISSIIEAVYNVKSENIFKSKQLSDQDVYSCEYKEMNRDLVM